MHSEPFLARSAAGPCVLILQPGTALDGDGNEHKVVRFLASDFESNFEVKLVLDASTVDALSIQLEGILDDWVNN